MNRDAMIAAIQQRAQPSEQPWDIAVIGGGATGVGIALDAASRGYSVVLLERGDFGKGTSSRSTKLIHGGVRYLEQGNIPLVMGALKERGILRRNAPHLVHDLAFIVPTYDWWEGPFYGIGLRVYDLLAGKYGFGRSRNLSREQTLQRIPTLKPHGLRGGVCYFDGQFDDARLLIALARTAAEHGATLANYANVTGLIRGDNGLVSGVLATDVETGQQLRCHAKVVINATGPFCDEVRRLADPGAAPMIAPSQGVHLVLDRSFLPGDTAIMVPHTSDGRVMFAIPWLGRTLVGTTDTPVPAASPEPRAMEQEIEFILNTVSLYLERPPRREDVLSVFAGIRPLVAAGKGSTAALSRDHTIHIDQVPMGSGNPDSNGRIGNGESGNTGEEARGETGGAGGGGMLSIAGGKWTTYRHMAEDAVDHAAILGELEDRPCITRDLHLHGYDENAARHGPLAPYGSDAPAIIALAGEPSADASIDDPLHPSLPYTPAQVIWAARHEMARTLEDALARRTRALFLDARAALAIAPQVAAILARELGRAPEWEHRQLDEFEHLAAGFTM